MATRGDQPIRAVPVPTLAPLDDPAKRGIWEDLADYSENDGSGGCLRVDTEDGAKCRVVSRAIRSVWIIEGRSALTPALSQREREKQRPLEFDVIPSTSRMRFTSVALVTIFRRIVNDLRTRAGTAIGLALLLVLGIALWIPPLVRGFQRSDSPDGIRFEGSLVETTHGQALLNGQWLSVEGHVVADDHRVWTVSEIHPRRVVLTSGGRSCVLRLRGSNEEADEEFVIGARNPIFSKNRVSEDGVFHGRL